ncbi:MAG: VanZ family protein [Candidatus Omnitrophica bacterium]|nr:VanZ family protein [Candidatus Omnitrophota bacterium]
MKLTSVQRNPRVALIFWTPVLIWMGFIFLLSSIPGNKLPEIPVPNVHKMVHFAEYSILGALFIRAFLNTKGEVKAAKLVIITLAVISVFALSDEWHQKFVTDRSADISDSLTDVVYSAIGIYFYFRTKRLFSGRGLKNA